MDEPNASGSRATTETQQAAGAGAQPSEEDLRAAYEAELNRITSSDLILQTTVSLINIGGRRLGLTAPGVAPAESESDLEQVRDAIDGARALMPILERHMPNELGPMRDAIAQLQMAYARGAQSRAWHAGGQRGRRAYWPRTGPVEWEAVGSGALRGVRRAVGCGSRAPRAGAVLFAERASYARVRGALGPS
jgi:hypothetical protein